MQYYYMMYLRTSEICALKTTKLILSLSSRLAWQAALKKTEPNLDLLAEIDMLLMVEKCIRGVIFHSIYRYAKANN